MHFSTGETLRTWYQPYSEKENLLFLCDYELLGDPQNGLQVIESMGIAAHSILVSSHFDDVPVRLECEKLGVRLIPKGMAHFVPIHVRAEAPPCPIQKWDAVLIDDDKLIHMFWKAVMGSQKKSLLGFMSVAEFLSKSDEIEKNTQIYIDVDLGKGIRGEVEAQKLYHMGFRELYLTTGYEPCDFKGSLSYVKGIIDKKPPSFANTEMSLEEDFSVEKREKSEILH